MTDLTIRTDWTASATLSIPIWWRHALRRATAFARFRRIAAHSRANVIANHTALSQVRLMADVGGDPAIHRDRDNWIDNILRHSLR